MSNEPTARGQPPTPTMVALAAATYAQREGKILILKRGMGEVSGGWYIPGGAVDPGEGVEDAARRELWEETGLAPSGPLTLIGLVPMHVYGTDMIQATYACDCPAGEVSISAEHSGARWIDPREYRDLHFRDEVIAAVLAQDERVGAIIQAVRDDLDQYLAWRDRQLQEKQVLGMRLTADMFVLRDGKMLILKRKGGVGDGIWYVPGGIVESSEDPSDAAVRETLEETGLRVQSPQLLRVWSWRVQNGPDIYHATYVADSPPGDVELSDEHSSYEWIDPKEYIGRYWHEGFEASVPAAASWFHQVRRNVELVASRIVSEYQG